MGTGALGLGLLIFFQNCSGNFESAGIKSLSSTQSTLAEKCTQNQVCQFVNGIGVKVCSANGTLADCQVTGCFAGYRQENNDCVPTNCTPGASESCADGNKTGNKICKSDGTGYDDCVLNGCAEGFYLAGDQCLTNCTPGTSTMCEDNTGRGMKYCTSDGKGYSICKYRSCLPQFNYNASAQTCTRGGE